VADQVTFAAAGSLATARSGHTATLLQSGRVLVAGGYNGNYLASAELYDPTTNTWSAAGSLVTARHDHTATLLPSGKVLVAGGDNGSSLASAELYDPTTNTWSPAGSLATDRYHHTATLLPSGKVLVADGYRFHDYPGYYSVSLASAELYDPATNTWSAAGSLATDRYHHTATLLPSGKVLVAGGFGSSGTPLASADLYDPTTNTWSAASSMANARSGPMATLLESGKVLVAGGWGKVVVDGGWTTVSLHESAELYNPATNTWSAAGSLATARSGHTATLLPSGKALVVGGYNAEMYDPTTNTWSAAGSLAVGRGSHTATLLPYGERGGGLLPPGQHLWGHADATDQLGCQPRPGAGTRRHIRCRGQCDLAQQRRHDLGRLAVRDREHSACDDMVRWGRRRHQTDSAARSRREWPSGYHRHGHSQRRFDQAHIVDDSLARQSELHFHPTCLVRLGHSEWDRQLRRAGASGRRWRLD
jgi:N-acetylneuraminic acid mutarotase